MLAFEPPPLKVPSFLKVKEIAYPSTMSLPAPLEKRLKNNNINLYTGIFSANRRHAPLLEYISTADSKLTVLACIYKTEPLCGQPCFLN